MTRIDVVGFGGLPKAGKDASADILAQSGWLKVNMSTPIDALARHINPWIPVPAQLGPVRRLLGRLAGNRGDAPGAVRWYRYNDLVAEVGFTDAKTIPEFRRVLQDLGSGARDELYQFVWVDKAREAIRGHVDAGHRVVLSGVRTPEEIALVDGFGGITVWVDRPGVVRSQTDANHAIENSVTPEQFHTRVANDGTLIDLGDKLASLLNG